MVHRDLKLENILLSNSGDSKFNIKVIKHDGNINDESFSIQVTDFGLSHMKGLPGCDDLMSSRCGTLYYMG